MIELDKVLAIPENLSGLTMDAPNWQISAYQRKQKLANASHKAISNSPRVDKIRHDPKYK